jgi:hypothetical protein
MLAEFGASPNYLGRLAEDLSRRIITDVASRGPDAIRVPQSLVAGEKYSFSLEIENVSYRVGSDGSFSFRYSKVSVSVTAESYVAGLGASKDQVAAYFGGGPGTALLLPEKGDAKRFRLLVPVDPSSGLFGADA